MIKFRLSEFKQVVFFTITILHAMAVLQTS